MKLLSTVIGGNLAEIARTLIKGELQKNEGGAVSIEIKKHSTASLQQWGYLYGIVYPVAAKFFEEEQGEKFSIKDVDHFLKEKFWYEIRPVQGVESIKWVKTPKDKKQMNKGELGAYIDAVILFLEEYGCLVPPPVKDGEGVVIVSI